MELVVQCLMEQSADVNTQVTLLYRGRGFSGGMELVVQCLMEHSADVNTQVTILYQLVLKKIYCVSKMNIKPMS